MDDQEPGYPIHGGLTPLRGLLPKTRDSIRTAQQMRSAITGVQPMAEPPSNGTGMQPSGRGAGGTPIAAWAVRVLAPFDIPEATMRCLSNSLTSRIVVVKTGKAILGKDGQFERTDLGEFQIKRGMTEQEMRKDLAIVNGCLQFSDEADIAKHVARLMVRTKMRIQGEGEARLLAETMVMDLRIYPIDAVEWACEHWVEGGEDGKFFPSWAELRELCERRVTNRKRLKKALEYYLTEAA